MKDSVEHKSQTEVEEDESTFLRKDEKLPKTLIVLPLSDVIVFPEVGIPISLAPGADQDTLEQARSQSQFIGCLAMKDAHTGLRSPENLYEVGTLARVLRSLRQADGSVTLFAQGVARFRVLKWVRKEPFLIAKVEYPDEVLTGGDEEIALTRNLQNMVREIVSLSPAYGDEFGMAVLNLEGARMASDFAAAYFIKDPEERQKLLSTFDVFERLEQVLRSLTRECELLKLGRNLQDQINQKIEKSQREFFLREQIKAIRKELGEDQDESVIEIQKFEERIDKAELPPEVLKKALDELKKLKLMNPEASESSVVRHYLEWIVSLPWSKTADETVDVDRAKDQLDRDHCGLEEVKERILEFLAVRKLRADHRGPILCFVGPPGVGKTSLGRSIADALSRPFVRLSLGGMRDEAEIRGHRRTYIGSMPGRIIQGLKTAGANNPVFLLDEIDKVGQDFRGDPSSALLEALDPEQNSLFSDHYLEVPFDLSKVFFIATANQLDTMSPPLVDRMEVIELDGYTLDEKLEIAHRQLIEKQIKAHGLSRKQVRIQKSATKRIIRDYTREAGVRSLEKKLAKLCRKAATRVVRDPETILKVTPESLEEMLGVSLFREDVPSKSQVPGVALGLAWTPAGGEVLRVEAVLVPGRSGEIQLTGKLGEVMMESARIAFSFVRSEAEALGIDIEILKHKTVHLHVPAGAIPKDGPSAGITMASAIASLLIGRSLRSGWAMTGELTLTGNVLPVGGVRDKILAAKRVGIKQVILPKDNDRELREMRPELLRGVRIEWASSFADVFKIVGLGS